MADSMPGAPRAMRWPRRNASPRAANLGSSRERLYAGLCSAQNQRVNIMRALVGIHHLEIHHMANHAELVRYAVAAEHIARRSRDVQGLAAGVALHDGRDFHRRG